MVHDYFLGMVMKHPKPKYTTDSILRKHLNADALFKALHTDFSKISDFRPGDVKISMADALMSGFAVFSLKEQQVKREETDNLDKVVSRHIRRVLLKTQGKVHGPDGAAAVLGINPSTLRNRMKKLGIDYGRKSKLK